MKFLIVLILSLGLLSCNSQPIQPSTQDSLSFYRDGYNKVSYSNSLLQKNLNDISKFNDSLKNKLFLSDFKIEKVKFYIKICKKNPSQKVFFFGWIDRAVN